MKTTSPASWMPHRKGRELSKSLLLSSTSSSFSSPSSELRSPLPRFLPACSPALPLFSFPSSPSSHRRGSSVPLSHWRTGGGSTTFPPCPERAGSERTPRGFSSSPSCSSRQVVGDYLLPPPSSLLLSVRQLLFLSSPLFQLPFLVDFLFVVLHPFPLLASLSSFSYSSSSFPPLLPLTSSLQSLHIIQSFRPLIRKFHAEVPLGSTCHPDTRESDLKSQVAMMMMEMMMRGRRSYSSSSSSGHGDQGWQGGGDGEDDESESRELKELKLART